MVGLHLGMLNLSLYLCRTEFETVSEFEFQTELRFFKKRPAQSTE